MQERKHFAELSNELNYHRYMLSQGEARGLLRNMTMSEYIALHKILAKDHGAGKTYLQEIAEELHLSIPKTSKMIRKLNEKGVVHWSHDGDGSEGTYVTITKSGVQMMQQQEAFMEDYYGRVINKFGEENMIALLRLVKELEDVMEAEMNWEGDESDGDL